MSSLESTRKLPSSCFHNLRVQSNPVAAKDNFSRHTSFSRACRQLRFPTLATTCMFSRAFHRLHAFQRLSLLNNFSRAYYHLPALAAVPLAYFPTFAFKLLSRACPYDLPLNNNCHFLQVVPRLTPFVFSLASSFACFCFIFLFPLYWIRDIHNSTKAHSPLFLLLDFRLLHFVSFFINT